MDFACWTSGAWSAGTWVDGSWCPGETPPEPVPVLLFSSQLSTGYIIDLWREDEEIVIL